MRPSHSGVSIVAVLGTRSLLVLLSARRRSARRRHRGAGTHRRRRRAAGADQSQHRGTSLTTGADDFADIDGSGRYVLFDAVGHQHAPPGCALRRASTCATAARAPRPSWRATGTASRPERGLWATATISPNGRFLAYCSWRPGHRQAGLLPSNVQNPVGTWHPDTDVFVRDLRTGETRRLSLEVERQGVRRRLLPASGRRQRRHGLRLPRIQPGPRRRQRARWPVPLRLEQRTAGPPALRGRIAVTVSADGLSGRRAVLMTPADRARPDTAMSDDQLPAPRRRRRQGRWEVDCLVAPTAAGSGLALRPGRDRREPRRPVRRRARAATEPCSTRRSPTRPRTCG